MAGIIHSKSTLISTLIILFSFILISHKMVNAKPNSFGRSLDPIKFMGLKKEKLSHFRVYWHDIVSGPNPTAVRVAEAPSTNQSATQFGAMLIIDDPLTEGPSSSSKQVGRAQGFYAFSSINDVGLIMNMNFVFTVGKYNGSTISISGRNAFFLKVREMSIIGGSGIFRFARGYVQAKTFTANFTTHNAIVEYNIYVFHY